MISFLKARLPQGDLPLLLRALPAQEHAVPMRQPGLPAARRSATRCEPGSGRMPRR